MHPLYPNVITLSPGALIDNQINTLNKHLPIGWGIKDSFNELQLDQNEFTMAFEANWYCRLPNEQSEINEDSGLQLRTVKTRYELNRWITSWGEANGVFNQSLIENSRIDLVYAENDGKLVSGLASNQSGDSVGISNSFGSVEGLLLCIAYVAEKHPAKAIVGYGSKAEIDDLSSLGFKEIGDLRVWLSNGSSANELN